MKSYFFLPKCNMRGNIRAHIKKNTKEEERKKQRERENKNALSHARRLVVRRRRDLVGVVRHLVYFLRERTREVNSRAVHI